MLGVVGHTFIPSTCGFPCDGPAPSGGFRMGDRILEVNGVLVADLTLEGLKTALKRRPFQLRVVRLRSVTAARFDICQ